MSLIDRMNEEEGLLTMRSATKEQIINAEKQLELHFAKDYIAYLESFGTATFADHELTGICSSERLNVVDATMRARKRYPQMPQRYYVVEEWNIDHVIVVQDSQGIIYEYGPLDKAKERFNSLEEYLF